MGLIFFLLVFLVPIGEIFLLVKVGSVVGFLRVIIYLMMMGFLGSALIKAQGRDLIMRAQSAFSNQQVPSGKPLYGLLGILAGVLFIIPGVMSDIVGLLCILPGTKHLIALLMRGWLTKQLGKGRINIFGMGKPGGFGAGSFGGFGPRPNQRPDQGFGSRPSSTERDVSPKVIDVTPIKTDTTES